MLPEVAGERLPRHFGDGAGHLHAGRPAADDDECQEAPALALVTRQLGLLERRQDAAADARGILDALEPGRECGPVVMTEIRMRRAGRDDEEVERK